MKIKEIGIWLGVIAVLVGGLFGLITLVNKSPTPQEPVRAADLPPVSDEDFVKGASDSARLPTLERSDGGQAKVTLIEYGDFECPACAAYFPIVSLLGEEFKEGLRIAHRFFPLKNIHPNAMIAAQAAYSAGLQNKFWEMHDMLYENQKSWTNTSAKDTFIEYAENLELDMEKFKEDLDASSTKQFIENEANKATSLGVNSTPTFFLNGFKIQNPRDYEAFKKLIQDELPK